MIRRPFLAVLGLVVLALSVVATAAPSFSTSPVARAVVPPDRAELEARVAALTTAEMDGRRTGTPGGDHAARELAGWLAAAGLRPGGDNGTFLQSFVLSTGTRVAPGSSLEIRGAGSAPVRLEVGREWTPHGGSLVDEVNAEVVFVGHAVSAPGTGHDDFAGVEVRDRVALALDGAPSHLGLRHSRLDKLIAARERGARALLLVSDALPQPTATATRVDLVSATITRPAADALLRATGRSLAELGARIVDQRAPASFATGVHARVRVDLGREDRRGDNVVGIVPGTDPALADEIIVIGAHYDHLGSVNGAVYHGADDNASGTAVVVGLARAFAAAGGSARTLVFALFGAEEIGLVGSGHYVRQPARPLARTIAMLNFDMVGRLRDRKLHVSGVDSGAGLREAVTDAVQGLPLDVTIRGTPFAPSDHSRFYAAGVPVLFFFTGMHEDYHRPSDTPDKVNGPGLALVAAAGARITERLAAAARPIYVKVPRPPRERSTARTGDAFLGIVANGRVPGDGLSLSAVLPDGPAARAGVREGDVLVRFGDRAVDSFDELRTALRDRRPGDRVLLVYLREGRAHAASATLDARPND